METQNPSVAKMVLHNKDTSRESPSPVCSYMT